jgi:hypothetical protein
MDLVTFLRARLDEDKTEAAEAADVDSEFWAGVSGDGTYFARHDPVHVLSEVHAKRRIVAMIAGSPDFHDAMPTPGYAQPFHSPSVDVLIRVCQLLALPYDQHPDYNPEWKV